MKKIKGMLGLVVLISLGTLLKQKAKVAMFFFKMDYQVLECSL